MKTFYPECGKEVEYQVKELIEKKSVRGLEFEYSAEIAFCKEYRNQILFPYFIIVIYKN